MAFSLTILGSNSAIPSVIRNSSSQLLSIDGKLFLIDCAEGTQVQLRKYHKKIQSIEGIFISHLHGDHYFGIMGLLSTLHLLGRTKEMHIYSPPQLKNIIDTHHQASNKILRYPLVFHELEENTVACLIDNDSYSVNAFPLNHSIPAFGFIFMTKEKERNFRKDVLLEMDIHYNDIVKIKRGEDYIDVNGNHHNNEDLTIDPEPAASFAYCSDTSYYEEIIPHIKNVDLLYHEATFLEDKKTLANEVLHTTAKEAATIAKMANVKKLILGHFSSRYTELEPFLTEAREVFPETYLADDGDEYEIIKTTL